MTELQKGEGPANWTHFKSLTHDFGDGVASLCETLAAAAMKDGAKKADALNATVHELLYLACLIACGNALENLGRDPSPDQWASVTSDVFENTLRAIKSPDEPAADAYVGAA